MEVPVEGMKRGRVYHSSGTKQIFFISIIILLYSIVLPYCYQTAGEPRRLAAISAQEKFDAKWEAYGNATALNSTSDGQGIGLDLGLNDIDALNAEFGDEGDDVDLASLLNDPNRGAASNSTASSSWFGSWFGPSKEDKRAQKQQEEMIKKFNEKSESGPMVLPPTYLPSAWSCLALFLTLTIHALFYLMGHWIVEFKAQTLYSPAGKVDTDGHVLVVPPDNRGKSQLVQVKKSKASRDLLLEFQRQSYQYVPATDLSESERKSCPNGKFALCACPIDDPLSVYTRSKGLLSANSIADTKDKWGANHLSLITPSFLILLQQQLLSPLAIFQVFCALLWLLDEYWSYTVWTLCSVVIFEATTVFQRTRTQKMLGGMAPTPSPIYAYRVAKWQVVSSKDLLPGDLISVQYKPQAQGAKTPPASSSTDVSTAATTGSTTDATANGTNNNGSSVDLKDTEKDKKPKAKPTSADPVVPCDCLLLRGSAVLNESTLTGESVPQMKEALVLPPGDNSGRRLDINGQDRVNTLFSGTSVVTVDSEENDDNHFGVPLAPDGGAIAYVLRTGFSSSQGTLMQMIEFSQQSVSGDLRETGYALLLLLIFALVAAAYVMREGLEKGEKTQHELLLKCVIIITSVVPRQFPMQMAMAVNMALMALMKGGIFCTEPYRVPLAGKISHCLFDKTGTLTTDQLVPVGIVNSEARTMKEDNAPAMQEVKEASSSTSLVLAACHSLVNVETEVMPAPGSNGVPVKKVSLAGDPIELAALQGIEWRWDSGTNSALPGSWQHLEATIAKLDSKVAELTQTGKPAVPNLARQLELIAKKKNSILDQIAVMKRKIALCPFESVQIAHRHHFSSALQRMSVIACCTTVDTSSKEWYSLVKGSPEAIQKLLAAGAEPGWYTKCYELLAKKGLRVLALASRRIDDASFSLDKASKQSREWVEKDLEFAGFIAFECKIRADSPIVMKSLIESDHKVSMLTGDGILTSIHVAKECGICDKGKKYLSLLVDGNNKAYWNEEDTSKDEQISFDLTKIAELSDQYDLVCTEATFLAAAESVKDISVPSTKKERKELVEEEKVSPLWSFAAYFRVFARMSPHGKATVIRSIQKCDADHNVLMCGDGGKDVGALKQADVGMALLAGHANANTTDAPLEELTETAVVSSEGKKESGMSAEDALNAHEKALKKRQEETNKLRQAHMKKFQAKYQQEQAVIMEAKVKELTAKGEFMGMWGLMKDQANNLKNTMAAENARFMHQHGQVWDPKKDGKDDDKDASAFDLMSMMGDMPDQDSMSTGGLPMVRPGDASVAAPFTSRTPSVRSVIDLIRQGRCTLLSALMQQQIMMLESIIAAYTLSALSLHNARSSERQMMASSWLIMTAAVAFSYASPVDKMHPLRPIRSLFHPAVFFSTMGQAAIHIACMTFAVQLATEAMGPEALAEVGEFFKKAKAKEIDAADACEEDDMMCQLQAYWMAPFLPNLLNTTVFLVETSQMISVFFANYKGRPWMKGMLENHALFLSVFACIGGVVVSSWEMVPQMNDMLQFTPFPDDAYRYKVVALVMASIAGTFLWDRLCIFLFAPNICNAMIKEASKVSLKDLAPIGMTLVKVVVVVAILGTGNLLLAGGAFWWYRNYSAKNPGT
jgi:cation-transporting ATPase 13A1